MTCHECKKKIEGAQYSSPDKKGWICTDCQNKLCEVKK